MKVRIGIAIIAALFVVGLGFWTGYAQKVITAIPNFIGVDVTAPLPSPTPVDVPSPIPTPTDVPTIAPVPPTQAPIEPPKSFPQNPEPIQTPGQPTVAVPQALVTISANVEGDQHCPCPAPLTIEWLGIFQGGFSGVTPIFTWSDGHVGSSDTITYTTPGNYHSPSVKVTEIVNGVTYEMTAANPYIPFTIT
jgi:hypothetical protein